MNTPLKTESCKYIKIPLDYDGNDILVHFWYAPLDFRFSFKQFSAFMHLLCGIVSVL